MAKTSASSPALLSPSAVRAARLAEDLARRRERFARKYEGLAEAMKRYDKGATIAELWPQWSKQTGMSRHTLIQVVRGTYDTKLARALYVVLDRPLPVLPPRPITPRKGGIPRLNAERLLAIRAAARAGMPMGEIALEFGVHPNIGRLIINGSYRTRSMERALMLEVGTYQSPSTFEAAVLPVQCLTDSPPKFSQAHFNWAMIRLQPRVPKHSP